MRDQQGDNVLLDKFGILDEFQQTGRGEWRRCATIGLGQGSLPIGLSSARGEAVIGRMAKAYYLTDDEVE